MKTAAALDPANPAVHSFFAQLLVAMKRFPEAIAEADTAIRLADSRWSFASYSAYRGYALARAGDTTAARTTLKSAKLYRDADDLAYEIALIHLGLSEPDSAVAWLGKFLSNPATDIINLRSPFFDPLRSDPRFQSLVRRVMH